MDEEDAQEIARAYAEAAPGHVWEERISLAAHRLIPDGAKWAIRAKEQEILASDGQALYRLRDETDVRGVGTITAERIEVEKVSVREIAEGSSQEKPPHTRRREWTFRLRGEEELTFTTREKLEPGQSPEALEGLARGLARATGWSI